jgi:multidrug efflux pump subunit AcrA (membrane-fusion protein)
MRLGAVIVGRAEILAGQTAIRVPPTALIQTSATPAVWVVSRDGMRVHRHDVTVLRYDTDSVLISSGIEKGDLIVTAGVNLLAEGQEVKLLPEAAK